MDFSTEGKEGRIEDDISETKYNDDNSTLMRSSTREDDINESNALSERITIGLSENKIGDEEIHALVAVLSSNDNAHVVDLKNNKITNTGCRGLAALLRTTETIEEIDLSGNMISSLEFGHWQRPLKTILG